eukprot:gene5775-7822_t
MPASSTKRTAVAIPAATGDITLFDPAGSVDASAIDVSATMTHVRSTCYDATGPDIQTVVTFDIQARRTRSDAPRDVSFPYFISVVQGDSAVVAKRIGHVVVHFDAGRDRATRPRLTEKRKAGDQDAATDPLTRPEIRQAVLRATFEALVGFQLTEAQLNLFVRAEALRRRGVFCSSRLRVDKTSNAKTRDSLRASAPLREPLFYLSQAIRRRWRKVPQHFSAKAGRAIDSHAAARQTGCVDGGQPSWARAGETLDFEPGRRRSNRPGISQATRTARAESTLWKALRHGVLGRLLARISMAMGNEPPT